MMPIDYVPAEEIRPLVRLSLELYDLLPEPRLWKEKVVRGLCRITDAKCGSLCLLRGVSPKTPWSVVSSVDAGWEKPRSAEAFMRSLQDPQRPDPMRAIGVVAGETVTRTRRQVVADDVWAASDQVRDFRHRAGIDDCIYSLHRFPQRGWAMGLLLHRAKGAAPFGPRERLLVEIMHGEMGELYRRDAELVRLFVGGGNGLPPRMRQTLDLLLEGHSEQAVAKRMGLSPNTVHVHVRGLYGRFNVNSRAELMAQFVGGIGR
jgi:DNA-binding CsgD family transcriptional regulator